MIYGETEHDGIPVLNINGPYRHLFKVFGTTGAGTPVEAYVWDDCFGDAIESVVEWAGDEAADSTIEELNGYKIREPLYSEIKATTDKALEDYLL